MPKIIMLNGSARTGKNSFASFVEKHYRGGRVITTSTIDKYKNIAIRYYDWNGIKDEAGRLLLARLKYAQTEYNPNAIIEFIYKEIYYNKLQDNDVLIIMAREPAEYQTMQDHMKTAIHIKEEDLVTVCVYKLKQEETFNNAADKNVGDFKYDYYIGNDSTLDDLEVEAKYFVAHAILD